MPRPRDWLTRWVNVLSELADSADPAGTAARLFDMIGIMASPTPAASTTMPSTSSPVGMSTLIFDSIISPTPQIA